MSNFAVFMMQSCFSMGATVNVTRLFHSLSHDENVMQMVPVVGVSSEQEETRPTKNTAIVVKKRNKCFFI